MNKTPAIFIKKSKYKDFIRESNKDVISKEFLKSVERLQNLLIDQGQAIVIYILEIALEDDEKNVLKVALFKSINATYFFISIIYFSTKIYINKKSNLIN